jgi:endo-1,3(4)-beta-glucanase
VNNKGYNNVYVDYGNGYYNDHHFHYGYFLAAAATIAKYDSNGTLQIHRANIYNSRFDQGWMNEHETILNAFLRDIVNPSADDPYFTVVRCRDWFAGHSWGESYYRATLIGY